MSYRRWASLAATILIAGGYYIMDHHEELFGKQSPESMQVGTVSSSSTVVSSSKTDGAVDYGSVTDKVPTASLAQSVMSRNVMAQLHAKKIVYNQTGAFVLDDGNNNLNVDVTSAPYVHLSKPDGEQRPGVANALLNGTTRQYQNRTETGNARTMDPVGWHQLTYDGHKTLWNRGHSIGYALAGSLKGFDASEANPKNITTQTAWANQSSNGDDTNTGQNYYESVVRQALDEHETVRYRVTPVYDGDNLVPSGSHIEAKSTDKKLTLNVFIPNVQPGIKIDYATGNGSVVN